VSIKPKKASKTKKLKKPKKAAMKIKEEAEAGDGSNYLVIVESPTKAKNYFFDIGQRIRCNFLNGACY